MSGPDFILAPRRRRKDLAPTCLAGAIAGTSITRGGRVVALVDASRVARLVAAVRGGGGR